jgi:class 3 adenylate cyclase
MLEGAGPRTRRLSAFLARRARARPRSRPELDRTAQARLFRSRAVVFTDTADFTERTLRDGILHFMMVFDRAVKALAPVVRRAGGRLVKVEADSLLLCFPDPAGACRGVIALEGALRRLNRARPANERLRFSYGIGYGEVVDLERDVFGLEVNLASKIGEDLAKPGQALLTPAAAAALDARTLRRVSLHRIVTYGQRAIPVQRLRLGRPAGSRGR